MSSGAWPNLFIVGVARGGTTSLWHSLGQHPDIYMCPLKEPWFFARAQIAHAPFPKDEETYLQLFAAAGQARWRGEASTSYFWDEEAAERIKGVSPEARIVVSLRDPVARAYSGYWFAVVNRGEGRAFVDVIRAELAELHEEHRTEAGHIDQGHYVDDLERYFRLFGDNVHVLFFEEFVVDPRRETQRIFEFLQVDPSIAGDLEIAAHNASRAPRNALIRRLLGFSVVRGFGRAVVPLSLQPRVEALVRGGRVPELDAEAKDLLERIYEPDRDRLETLLGRPLPWPATRGASAAPA